MNFAEAEHGFTIPGDAYNELADIRSSAQMLRLLEEVFYFKNTTVDENLNLTTSVISYTDLEGS